MGRRLMVFGLVLLVSFSVNAKKTLDYAYLKCQYGYQYEDDTLSHHLSKDRLEVSAFGNALMRLMEPCDLRQ